MGALKKKGSLVRLLVRHFRTRRATNWLRFVYSAKSVAMGTLPSPPLGFRPFGILTLPIKILYIHRRQVILEKIPLKRKKNRMKSLNKHRASINI